MNLQIKKAIYYIETHLDDELDGRTLAKIAGYSPFHFCRIFKVNIGESLKSYTIRLRLERASNELLHKKKNIIEVALDAGYQTPTGFLKAFKLRFGTTPTQYKKSAKTLYNKYKEIQMNTPELITREDTPVIFTRELGNYMHSSEVAWKRLSEKADSLNLDKKNSEAIGICHDDPQVTDEKNLRYDASLTLDKKKLDTLVDFDVETKTLKGGKYAKVLYKGSYEQAEDNWYGLYDWIEKKSYEVRDEPAFEKYLNMPNEVEENELLTEIYVPIL